MPKIWQKEALPRLNRVIQEDDLHRMHEPKMERVWWWVSTRVITNSRDEFNSNMKTHLDELFQRD